MDNIVTKSVRVGSAGYYVNRDHLVISKPEAGNIADITEQAIAAGKVLIGRNIVLYALAAFMDDEENPGQQRLAPNATLINEGIIEIHLHDIVEAYKDQVKATPDDPNGTYRFVKCFAMAAGKDSTLINEGTIRIYFDQEKDLETAVYGETLLAGENSTVINNGVIELVGNGSFDTQTRVIALPVDNVTIINNGQIHVNVEKASTVRVLATTGTGGTIANYGSIKINSTGRIMTIARFANTHLINAGAIVTSLDSSAERLQTLRQNLKRLHFAEPEIIAADALQWLQTYQGPAFDIILLDAPCSATGIFRRHPEIIHFKTKADVQKQAALQKQILDILSRVLAPHGLLAYCVCSIAKAEGVAQIRSFLKRSTGTFAPQPITAGELLPSTSADLSPLITPEGFVSTLPSMLPSFGGVDAFFIAKLQKVK